MEQLNYQIFKTKKIDPLIAYIGSYVQALPKKTLEDEKSIDFVFINEGVYSLHELLKINKFDIENLEKIPGIAFRNQNKEIQFTKLLGLCPQKEWTLIFPDMHGIYYHTIKNH